MEPSEHTNVAYNEENVNELFRLVEALSLLDLSDRKKSNEFKQWVSKISDAPTKDLVALIGLLDTLKSSPTSRAVKALREAVISQVSFTNATLISNTMQRLDKTAGELTILSIVLSLIGIVIAVLQVILK